MSAISANLAVPPDNFSTTLSSGVASNGLTIALNSVSGLPTEGVGVLFTKDTNGDVNVGSVEIIHWTNVSGSSLILSDTGDRGLTGSDAGAQAYSTEAYFEVWVTSYYYKSLRDGVVGSLQSSALDTDGTLAANSDSKIATQKATKTYVDGKKYVPKLNSVTSSATPSINVDTTDQFSITALATAITSMTSGLSGTPTNGQKLTIRIKDDGTARSITWGASFVARGATLPTTTVISKYTYVGLIYNSTASIWDCVAVSQEV